MPKMKHDTERVGKRLRKLEKAPIEEIRLLWAKYFEDAPPKHYQRSFMIRRIGYHMQAMAYGGLSKSMRTRLKRLANDPAISSPPTYQYASGTRIIKNWKGKRLVVIIEGQHDFMFEGRRYKSLSTIASELVGSRQSGPRFFGITQQQVKEQS